MATKINAKCKKCNNNFYIFEDFFKTNADIVCPYCYATIQKEYTSYLNNAFKSVKELNYTIRSRYEDGICDLFEFDFEEVYVPIEKLSNSQSQ